MVDGEHDPLARRHAVEHGAELRRRSFARSHEHGFRLQRRKQAGAKERGLAAAGRPDDREQRHVRKPRDELVNEPLATEEELRVFGFEWGESLERADIASRRRRALTAVEGDVENRVLNEDRPLELL